MSAVNEIAHARALPVINPRILRMVGSTENTKFSLTVLLLRQFWRTPSCITGRSGAGSFIEAVKKKIEMINCKRWRLFGSKSCDVHGCNLLGHLRLDDKHPNLLLPEQCYTEKVSSMLFKAATRTAAWRTSRHLVARQKLPSAAELHSRRRPGCAGVHA